MKEKNIRKLIQHHYDEKLYGRITRLVDKKYAMTRISYGYIVQYSEDFVVLKEEDEFLFLGYNIIPVKTIKKIRYNDNDKYRDFINKSEYPESAFFLDEGLKIDLSSWRTIFDSLLAQEKVVISECERDKHRYFAIGSIASVDDKATFINYFDAQGRLDKEPVKHKYNWITKVTFDDNYSKVFSKYIRE